MELDFETLAANDRYKVLTATIVPRPIAWVTTLSRDGRRNAAPFSFFNAMSKDPPLIALGIQSDRAGAMKDTARNILETGEFVVNLVPRAAAEAMSLTSTEDHDVDEIALASLATRPSTKIKPPRIALSPVAFECRLHTPLSFGPGQLIAIGEIVAAHIDDGAVADRARLHIDTRSLDLVGRMQGRDRYVMTRETFVIERPEAGSATARPDDADGLSIRAT